MCEKYNFCIYLTRFQLEPHQIIINMVTPRTELSLGCLSTPSRLHKLLSRSALAMAVRSAARLVEPGLGALASAAAGPVGLAGTSMVQVFHRAGAPPWQRLALAAVPAGCAGAGVGRCKYSTGRAVAAGRGCLVAFPGGPCPGAVRVSRQFAGHG